MKKRKWLIAAVIDILVIIIILGIVLKTGESASGSDDETGSVSEGNGIITEDDTQGETNDSSVTASDTAEGGTAGNGNGIVAEKNEIVSGDSVTTMAFPYTDDSSEIVIEALYSYSGYFLEDGSEDEVDEIALLEVTNTSEETIEYGTIRLTADGEALEFDISLIPAGATVLVMETNKANCSESADCSYEGSEIAYLSELDMCEDQVTVSTDSGAITVTNISGNDISELRLFYKNRLDTGEYVGGIAYTVKLEDLGTGESVTVYPSHFDPEYGVVMMIRIYD